MIRPRLLLALLGIVAVALVVLQLFAVEHIEGAIEQRMLARLDGEARLVAGSLVADGAIRADADDVVDALGELLGLRITVITPDGVVRGDTELDDPDLAHMDSHAGRPEVQQALAEGVGLSARFSDTLRTEMNYRAVRIGDAKWPVAVVRLAIPTQELREMGRSARRATLLATVLVGLLIAVVGYGLARRAGESIRSLRDMAARLASGAAGVTSVEAPAAAVVAEISRSLHAVGDRLSRQVSELSQERNLLRTILSGMREGLLIVDADERIVEANPYARSVFPSLATVAEGRAAVEAVRDPEFLELIRAALRDGLEGQKRLSLFDGRSLEIRVVPLEGPGLSARGALALLLDVTQMDRLESVRRDFVANVSHELRTPLSSIRAFVETLLDEAGLGEQQSEFLKIIDRNAHRMEALVSDLTDLSLIETGAIALAHEWVPARALVLQSFESVQARAIAGDVTLRCDVAPELRIWGDPRRLEQVMLNLVDNAVKFNRPGGGVRVDAETRVDTVIVRVSDDGPGIPPEHRENVFHRFFRMPGSPRREGTGLGLAIVKHLMRLHGGSVEVTSVSSGPGSSFLLRFPATATTLAVDTGSAE